MDIQRLRNLTTGRLHTEVKYLYQDMEHLTGMEGIMTHMLPNVNRAMLPWLKEQIAEKRFWDGKCDTSHTGEFEIEQMDKKQQALMLERYSNLPHPFESKKATA